MRLNVDRHSRYSAQPPSYTTAQWLSTLKLSSKWHLKDLRKVAIAELSQAGLAPIEQICLAREHGVSAWLLDGCERLVERGTELTEAEGEKIGWRTALQLSGLIISVVQSRLRPGPPQFVRAEVLQKFKAEVTDMRKMSKQYLTESELKEADEAAKLEAENEALERELEKQAAERSSAQEQAQALREEMARLQGKLTEVETRTLQLDNVDFDSVQGVPLEGVRRPRGALRASGSGCFPLVPPSLAGRTPSPSSSPSPPPVLTLPSRLPSPPPPRRRR